MHPPNLDDLSKFSGVVFMLEYVVIKLTLLALSLYGLFKFAQNEVSGNSAPGQKLGCSTKLIQRVAKPPTKSLPR